MSMTKTMLVNVNAWIWQKITQEDVKLHYSSYVIYNGIAKEVIFVIKYTGMNKIKTGTHSHTGIVLNVFHEKSDEIDNIDFTISLQFGLLDLVAGDFLLTKL